MTKRSPSYSRPTTQTMYISSRRSAWSPDARQQRTTAALFFRSSPKFRLIYSALRERIRLRYGDEGLIEMALAIATCRGFPTIKHALGYAVSCAAEEVRV